MSTLQLSQKILLYKLRSTSHSAPFYVFLRFRFPQRSATPSTKNATAAGGKRRKQKGNHRKHRVSPEKARPRSQSQQQAQFPPLIPLADSGETKEVAEEALELITLPNGEGRGEEEGRGGGVGSCYGDQCIHCLCYRNASSFGLPNNLTLTLLQNQKPGRPGGYLHISQWHCPFSSWKAFPLCLPRPSGWETYQWCIGGE